MGIFHAIFDTPLSLNQFFSSRYYSFTLSSGFSTSSCMLLAGVSGAFLLSIIVERSKKCVDFTVTAYFLHVLFCYFWNGILPLEFEFWIAMMMSSFVCASLGEFLCSRSEMEDIPLYINSSESHGRLNSKSSSMSPLSPEGSFSTSLTSQR